MQQAQAQAGERPGAELVVHLRGGAELGCGEEAFRFGAGLGRRLGLGLGGVLREVELGLIVLGSFDDGVDQVGLAAERDLLADESPDLGGLLFGRPPG